MIIVKGRELLIPENERYIGTNYDAGMENRLFRIPRYSQSGTDLSDLTFKINLIFDGDPLDRAEMTKEIDDDYIYLTWAVTAAQVAVTGTVFVCVTGNDTNDTVKWSSFQAAFYTEKSLGDDIDTAYHDLINRLDQEIADRGAAVTTEASVRQEADIALQQNIDAETAARTAADTATNARISNIVAQAGSDNTEIVDARVDADGSTHTVLKDRLDTEYNNLRNQLLQQNAITIGEIDVSVNGAIPSNRTVEKDFYFTQGHTYTIKNTGDAAFYIYAIGDQSNSVHVYPGLVQSYSCAVTGKAHIYVDGGDVGDAFNGIVKGTMSDTTLYPPLDDDGYIIFDWTIGIIINKSGSIGDSVYFATSDYVHVVNGDILLDSTPKYKEGLGAESKPYIIHIAVYDADRNFVKRVQFGAYTRDYIIENDGYVRIVFGFGAYSGIEVQASDLAVVKISKFNKVDALQNIADYNGTVSKLLAVAKTYEPHMSDFTYDPFGTAWSPTCDWTLDCSSFHALLVNGVTFEKSRYYSGAAENFADPEYFPDMYCYPKTQDGEEVTGTYDADGFPHCRYAYQQAQWLYDHGHTYIPAEDMSNIEPGDTIFFSFNEPSTPPENVITWKDGTQTIINHVAIFLGKTSNRYLLLQYGDYESVGVAPSSFYEIRSAIMRECVLAAHIPYRFNQNLPVNLSTLSLGKNAADGRTAICKVTLSEPLVPGELYTLCFYSRINVESKYIILQSTTWTTIYSDVSGREYGHEKLKCIHFVCPSGLSDYTQFWINTTGDATSGEDASYAYCIRLYKGCVVDGVVGNAQYDDALIFVNRQTLQNLLDAIETATGEKIKIKTFDDVNKGYTFEVV